MPDFSSFALQFSGFTATSLSATNAQLLIVEAGVTSASGQPTLGAQDLANLAAEGRTVVGYVNTSVTDHNRAYWQAGWVTPSGDEPDVGTVNPTAPDWLSSNLGTVDFDPAHPGPEAILVDYRDPDWRALVVAQAVAVVQAGFHGVFLDDVARYYEAARAGGEFDRALADSMMQLVIQVAAAVRAVDPDATVIVNSGVYIGGDSSDGTGSQLFADYKAAIDGVLIENQYGSQVDPAPPNVLTDAQTNFAGIDILALENAASGLDRMAFLAFAAANGILPYISPDAGYGGFATAPQIDWNGLHYLAGSPFQANVLFGLGGNDILQGGSGADTVYGGTENDQLLGLTGSDLLYGEDGDDTLTGGIGDDSLFGGAGNDIMHGEGGNDVLYGQVGNDTLRSSGVLFGGDGTDYLAGYSGNDSLYAGAGGGLQNGDNGADSIFGGSGADTQSGGHGNDRIFGWAGQDRMHGGRDNDLVAGGDGNDYVDGGIDDDTLLGQAGDDFLYGTYGNDSVSGGIGNDTLRTGSENDTLRGEAGNDEVYGGSDNDLMYGGKGDDTLNGVADDDRLYGGLGSDVFAFSGYAGIDTIHDFNNLTDLIDLSAYRPSWQAVRAAIRDWNGGVTIDLDRVGAGTGLVRILDHGGQVITLTVDDFILL